MDSGAIYLTRLPIMTKPSGRYVALTPFRSIVNDLMHFSKAVPVATVERKINLGAIKSARNLHPCKPSWTSIFAKAYGMVARDIPDLRRTYMSFPWPHFYEHPHSVASINVEREVNGERIVLYSYVRSPETRPLEEIDEIIRHHKEDPIEQVRSYTRTKTLGMVPSLIRKFVWWYTLNVQGKLKTHNFGTFAISSVSSMGAGLVNLLPIVSTQVHYGMLDKDGNLDVRLSFDHRVMDGGNAARALVALDEALNRSVLYELAPVRKMAA